MSGHGAAPTPCCSSWAVRSTAGWRSAQARHGDPLPTITHVHLHGGPRSCTATTCSRSPSRRGLPRAPAGAARRPGRRLRLSPLQGPASAWGGGPSAAAAVTSAATSSNRSRSSVAPSRRTSAGSIRSTRSTRTSLGRPCRSHGAAADVHPVPAVPGLVGGVPVVVLAGQHQRRAARRRRGRPPAPAGPCPGRHPPRRAPRPRPPRPGRAGRPACGRYTGRTGPSCSVTRRRRGGAAGGRCGGAAGGRVPGAERERSWCCARPRCSGSSRCPTAPRRRSADRGPCAIPSSPRPGR